jgi:NDP-sugar pyrophosphorylase family protein
MPDLMAAILAGGRGTRLRSVLSDRPKVLAPVAGRPYLSLLLDRLTEAGLNRVVLLTGYLADQVQRVLGESYRGMRLVHSPEPRPLGTGGALRHALPHLKSDRVLILNGDSWCDVALAEFYAFHRRKCAAMSLVLSHQSDTERYGRVQVDDDGRVTHFAEKRGRGPAWINAGVYLLERRLIEEIPEDVSSSLEHDLIPGWLDRQENVFGMYSTGRFLDIGTPESYAQAEHCLCSRVG